MTTIRARVLSNMVLPDVAGYVIKTFGDYCPNGSHSAPWQAQFERRTLAEILPLIPSSEKPDILVIASPEYLPIPIDIGDFVGLKILLITDWNICLRFLPALCPLFDLCFTDWPGTRILKAAGVTQIKHQPLFGHNPEIFRNTNVTRNLDVSFCGNLNSGIHGERNRLLARLGKLPRVHLRPTFGKEYVDILNRSKLVFNYSIRGEANMRLFESMACGAVPLIEESNLEAGILFEEGKHFFRYKIGELETRIESLLAEPERLSNASHAAMAAVKNHTKAHQIEALLNLACSEFKLLPQSNGAVAKATLSPAPDASFSANKALLKLRVLGLGYTLKSAVEEIQKYSAQFPGLDLETMPTLFFSLLTQDNSQEPLPLLSSAVHTFIHQPTLSPLLRGYLTMKLANHKGEFTAAIIAATDCLSLLENSVPLDATLYSYFWPPTQLGHAFNTDLNQAFAADLRAADLKNKTCSRLRELLRAHCLLVLGESHLALGQSQTALTHFLQINLSQFASIDAYHSLIKVFVNLQDYESIRKVAMAWFSQKPLDIEVWKKLAEVYKLPDLKSEREAKFTMISELAHHFYDSNLNLTLKSLQQIFFIG